MLARCAAAHRSIVAVNYREIALSRNALAVRARTLAHESPEGRGKMRLIGEAAVEGNVRDQLSAHRKLPARALDTQAREALVRRFAIGVLEHANEMKATEARHFRQVL